MTKIKTGADGTIQHAAIIANKNKWINTSRLFIEKEGREHRIVLLNVNPKALFENRPITKGSFCPFLMKNLIVEKKTNEKIQMAIWRAFDMTNSLEDGYHENEARRLFAKAATLILTSRPEERMAGEKAIWLIKNLNFLDRDLKNLIDKHPMASGLNIAYARIIEENLPKEAKIASDEQLSLDDIIKNKNGIFHLNACEELHACFLRTLALRLYLELESNNSGNKKPTIVIINATAYREKNKSDVLLTIEKEIKPISRIAGIKTLLLCENDSDLKIKDKMGNAWLSSRSTRLMPI